VSLAILPLNLNRVKYEYLSTSVELHDFCARAASSPAIYFDTEFVSEDTYRPELCLIQIATDDELAVVDPQAVGDVSAFWELITTNGHQTVVHAGREEFRFCWNSKQTRPRNLFDVQIAAGLVGLDYPASYGKLIARLLGKSLPKGETRTDWRQRPLTERQIEYALQDVMYLPAIRTELMRRLDSLQRLSWLDEEMNAWQGALVDDERRERWRRVSGISGLSAKSLMIVRELWRWREQEAEATNKPPRRILRDDLIVELARRAQGDLQQIKAIRGIERSGAKRHLPAIAETIEKAMAMPREKWPVVSRPAIPEQVAVLGQFLAAALTSICHSQDLATSIVGTAQDVRDLVAYRMGYHEESDGPPALAVGWRSKVVGATLDDLLFGRTAIRIHDPLHEKPLTFEKVMRAPE